MPNPNTKTAAVSFVAALTELAAGNEAIVLGLQRAAEVLFELPLLAGQTSKVYRDALAEAMAEIERATRRAPFRVDTAAGPLFVGDPLWEAAGRSGGEWGGGRINPRPRWAKPYRAAALGEVA